MIKTMATAFTLLCIGSGATAAIYFEVPPGNERTHTQAVKYEVTPVDTESILEVDISGILSFNLLGSIPPNETLVVDVADALGSSGQPYRVIGLGWDVQLDAFVPSWMSDTSIAFGDNPTYADPDLLLSPGMGFDYPGFMRFQSGGIVDLTNFPGTGTDMSFELAQGILYLEFFELYDDFGDGPIPDAIWRPTSSLSIQVMAVPEPTLVGVFGLAFLTVVRLGYRQ